MPASQTGFTQEHLADITDLSARHIANRERGVNPSFEDLSTLVKDLGVSFDAIFDPADEQMEADIQEIVGLYRACPEQGQRLIWASTRAMEPQLSADPAPIQSAPASETVMPPPDQPFAAQPPAQNTPMLLSLLSHPSAYRPLLRSQRYS